VSPFEPLWAAPLRAGSNAVLLRCSPALHEQEGAAGLRAPGRVSALLPDQALFSTLCAAAALLSSQIEGTQSSLSDLLLVELEEAPAFPQAM